MYPVSPDSIPGILESILLSKKFRPVRNSLEHSVAVIRLYKISKRVKQLGNEDVK